MLIPTMRPRGNPLGSCSEELWHLGGSDKGARSRDHPAQRAQECSLHIGQEEKVNFSKVLSFISVQKHKTLVTDMAQRRSDVCHGADVDASCSSTMLQALWANSKGRGRGSWTGRRELGDKDGKPSSLCAWEIPNCCFQFLVTNWLCHFDPVVPLLLGSLGSSLPPANALGGAWLWAQCGEPGVQKRLECPPFPTLALKLEFSQR